MSRLKNHFLSGFVAGMIAPVVAFTVYSLLFISGTNPMSVIVRVTELNMLSAVIALCVFINLLVFFLFIWTNLDRSAKGVLGATFIYAFIIVYLKFAR